MRPRDFYKMTPLEFNHAVEVKNEMEDAAHKDRHERLRLLVQKMMNMQGRYLKRALGSPKEAYALPWDKKKQGVSEMKGIVHGIAAFFGAKIKKRKPKEDK